VHWSGRKPCLDWAQPHGSIWPPESPTCAKGSRACTVWCGTDCRVSLLAWRVLTLRAARSRQRSPLHCLPAYSARLASTRSRFGKSSLLGVSRIRAKCQSGGEFYASDGYWSKELVAYRQPAGRTEGWGDPFNSGKLPTVKTPGARRFGRGSSRACRSLDPAPPTPYSSCVGRPTFIDSNDRVGGCRRHRLFGTGMSVWKILRPFDIERKDFRSADIAGEQG
jgi:hypothetical protein